MNYRIWYSLCLLFLVYSLKLLIDDYYLVNYVIVEREDELYDDHTNYLLCAYLSDIKENNNLKYRPEILENANNRKSFKLYNFKC